MIYKFTLESFLAVFFFFLLMVGFRYNLGYRLLDHGDKCLLPFKQLHQADTSQQLEDCTEGVCRNIWIFRAAAVPGQHRVFGHPEKQGEGPALGTNEIRHRTNERRIK